jgi:DNA-binding NarL/FixJ family response regulator
VESNNKIKVMIADNHEIARIGMRRLLSRNKEIKITVVAEKGSEIFEKIKKHKPDVVIMDNNFNDINSADVTAYALKHYPDCKVIIHPSVFNEQSVLNEIHAGVSGYVPKNFGPANLIDAIKTVHNGYKFFKGNVADVFINNYFKEKRSNELLKQVRQTLSKKEIEILRMLCEGFSIKQISEKIFISIRTVETHRSNIRKKLKIHNTADLVKYAINKNLITA